VIVSFQEKDLHDCSYETEIAEARLGDVLAQALATLIADAEASETAEELMEIRNPAVIIDSGDSLLVPIGADCRARFVAVGHEFSRDKGGIPIWSSVRRLKLVALESN
jgi:hypothetical protein